MPLESAIINVKRLYKCSISEISQMFADDSDYEGLFFWAADAESYLKQIENSLGALQ